MELVIIDTNVVIDYLRTKKGLFLELLDGQSECKLDLMVSTATLLELFSGRSSKTEGFILEALDRLKIVPLDREIAILAGEINRDVNYSFEMGDLIIGVTAKYYEAKLATNNKKHFQKIPGLKFYNLPPRKP